MSNELDYIWKQAIISREENNMDEKIIKKEQCKNCDSLNIIFDKVKICFDCGLIYNNDIEFSNYTFEEPIPYTSSNNKYNRINKIQQWIQYTNTEKNEYKLKLYIRDLCEKLNIYENIIESVSQLVIKVMNSIKNHYDGPKRSRVKDGIIISCIYYISKENEDLNSTGNYNYLKLAKKINLDIKYVSKADKILMELDLSDINKKTLNKTENPINYVHSVITKYKLQSKISNNINIKTAELINICENNDILLDHTPLSVGAVCFYYILIKFNVNIDIKLFSNMFGVSIVTITKTLNKLKKYKNKLDENLNINEN